MEEHQVIENFTGEGNTELSVKIGDVVMVTSKDPSGEGVCAIAKVLLGANALKERIVNQSLCASVVIPSVFQKHSFE